jgi:hypothetical protein
MYINILSLLEKNSAGLISNSIKYNIILKEFK